MPFNQTHNPECILPDFSLVIPVYNEEDGILTTLDQLQSTFRELSCQYEIIVVNDGSVDDTHHLLSPRQDIRLIEHERNKGYGAALKTGIRHAQFSTIVITDADGTYPNTEIPFLLTFMEGADMVVGARIGKQVQYSTLRKIPKWFLVKFAEWITKQKIPDLNSGLRVMQKPVVDKFLNILPDTFSFTTTITVAMLTNNYIIKFIPVDYFARTGRSKIKPIRDTLRFLQIILRTGVYFAPLRVFLPIAGFFFSIFCFTLFEDIVIRHDLTERTLILLIAFTQIGIFALIADMIDKRI